MLYTSKTAELFNRAIVKYPNGEVKLISTLKECREYNEMLHNEFKNCMRAVVPCMGEELPTEECVNNTWSDIYAIDSLKECNQFQNPLNCDDF